MEELRQWLDRQIFTSSCCTGNVTSLWRFMGFRRQAKTAAFDIVAISILTIGVRSTVLYRLPPGSLIPTPPLAHHHGYLVNLSTKYVLSSVRQALIFNLFIKIQSSRTHPGSIPSLELSASLSFNLIVTKYGSLFCPIYIYSLCIIWWHISRHVTFNFCTRL